MIPLTFNTFAPLSFPLVETPLKFPFWYKVKLNFVFLLMSSMSSNLSFGWNFQFWKQEKVAGSLMLYFAKKRFHICQFFSRRSYLPAALSTLSKRSKDWVYFLTPKSLLRGERQNWRNFLHPHRSLASYILGLNLMLSSVSFGGELNGYWRTEFFGHLIFLKMTPVNISLNIDETLLLNSC